MILKVVRSVWPGDVHGAFAFSFALAFADTGMAGVVCQFGGNPPERSVFFESSFGEARPRIVHVVVLGESLVVAGLCALDRTADGAGLFHDLNAMSFLARPHGVEVLLALVSEDVFVVLVGVSELGFSLLGGKVEGLESLAIGFTEFVESLDFGELGLFLALLLLLAGLILPLLLFAHGLSCGLVGV